MSQVSYGRGLIHDNAATVARDLMKYYARLLISAYPATDLRSRRVLRIGIDSLVVLVLYVVGTVGLITVARG